MNPLRTAVNRVLLALAGASLLGGGAWLAGTAGPVAERLPGWWPRPAAGTVLLDRSTLADLRDQGWWTPVVIAGTACALLLSLTWLLAQVRSGGHRRLPLAGRLLTLRSRALADAVARRAEAASGVSRAHVTLLAGPKRSRARVRLRLEPGAAPGRVLEGVSHAALDEARRSLAPYPLTTHVHVGARLRREKRAR
ncbi:hypothetical protein ACFC5H_33075 [Streptomyces rochei]|uniref:Alkaline shock response membrane anchor protein AmaP n=1 Tax=Streptomyces rochei TaxID=1928 RepID=A0AAX3ZRW8_STRRO|nr:MULTISPECIES: hypothetical protein [Streptomyces]WDI21332.1 hypothetical protein PS783_28625 [Streptomyces enissocaesilis]MBQ0883126.1 hypothetical protein [Streptomyces sp. RT42]QCR50308.1 hypothetical protein C1N79_28950 [Streptomyces sp. SGAir0924]RSS13219.1 hypothetical protein EF914_32620 [Streptomyces sp. WAC05458]RSS91126.1 hypothetical protein EF919_22430 [Streptomyces sp. WAC02707]